VTDKSGIFNWEPHNLGDRVVSITRVRDHWIAVTEMWIYRLTEDDYRNPGGFVVEKVGFH